MEWAAENRPEDFWRWGALALLSRVGHLDAVEIGWVLEEYLAGGDFTTKRKMREVEKAAHQALAGVRGAAGMNFKQIADLPKGGGLKAGEM